MRPGGWYTAPLLSADESLEERIAADARRLEAAGVPAADLGRELGAVLDAAADSDWHRPSQHGALAVEIHRNRGILTCPWAPEQFASCGQGDGGKRAGANQFVVRSLVRDASLEGFVLSAHLIAEHDFFGGEGTAFRIEPEELLALLRDASAGEGGGP